MSRNFMGKGKVDDMLWQTSDQGPKLSYIECESVSGCNACKKQGVVCSPFATSCRLMGQEAAF